MIWLLYFLRTCEIGLDDNNFLVITADDLISLLDAGMHPDHPSVIIDADAMFSEDMFNFSGLRSRAGNRGRAG